MFPGRLTLFTRRWQVRFHEGAVTRPGDAEVTIRRSRNWEQYWGNP